MTAKRAVLVASSGLLFMAPIFAHHSFKAEYDETRQITLTGTITKVLWKNPHVLLYIDLKDDGAKAINWELELASPNGLMSQGWKIDSLKLGDQVTASGFRAKDGSNILSARKITLDTH